MNKLRFFSALILSFISLSLFAVNPVTQRIIETGRTDNRTMQHLDVLANRIGPRPIGSNAYTNATYWVADMLKSWGLEVEIQEVGEVPVGFNRGPWFGRAMGEETMHLDFVTPSYTSGTKGLQRGPVLVEPKTQQEFDRMKGKLKGAWVLIEGKNNGFAIDYSKRGDAVRDSLKAFNAAQKHDSTRKLVPALFYREMVEAGILGIIQSAPVPLVAVYDRNNLWHMSFDNLPTTPDIKLNETQYKKIRESVERREFVLLEFDIRNYFRPGPVKYHNVIGKIRGVKYPDEYVMTGCHLDSHDAANGAVDCGTGVAPNLEMARMIMQAGGCAPDRSILFCFWTGEEYGLIGSRFWVEQNKDKLHKISNYFNRDGGPTAASGLVVPENMYDDILACTEGLADYDPQIPFKVEKSSRPPQPVPTTAGGSDHAYFAMNGVPVIHFSNTDPLGYNFNYREIWHTNRDRYDMSIPEYMNYTSVTQAVTVYNLANLPRLLPRDGLYLPTEKTDDKKEEVLKTSATDTTKITTFANNNSQQIKMKKAIITTAKGVMKVEFYEKDAPNTVKNFCDLAEKGFYNGLTFHRVIPDFVIQGGCPNGTGSGGPGYKINCELDGDNQYHDRGVLSMAHAGRNTGGSQFFICHSRKNTAHLDRNHTCFGKVVEGLEVIDAIRQGDVIESIVILEE